MYILVVRHFKTDSRDRINYPKVNYEASRYVDHIIDYINKFGIEKIEFHSSPHDRTFLTSCVLSNILKDRIKITIENPICTNEINRDPLKKRKNEIYTYFKELIRNGYFSEKKLVIYVTHSSVYKTIVNSIIQCVSKTDKIDDRDWYIHSYSMSHITYHDGKLKYSYNRDMHPSK